MIAVARYIPSLRGMKVGKHLSRIKIKLSIPKGWIEYTVYREM